MPQDPNEDIHVRIFRPEEELDETADTDLDLEAETAAAQEATHAAFADALAAIEQGSIELRTLTGLSDLSREQVAQLADIWRELPVQARTSIAEHAYVLGEDDLLLDFMRFFAFALDDEASAVRQYAALGLAAYDDPALIDPLVRLATTDVSDDVRAAAVEALGSFADMAEFGVLEEATAARVRQTLVGILADDDAPAALRAHALEAVAVLSGDREIPDAIQRFADAEESELRLGSIRAMARSASEQWLPLLEATLRSPDPDARQEAVAAIGAFEDEGLVPLITRVAREDREITVRLEAIQMLGVIGGATALHDLRILREHASEDELDAIDEAIVEAAQRADQDDESDDDDLRDELRRLGL